MKDAIVDTPAISIIDDDESLRVAAGRFALAERLDLLLLVDPLGTERSTRRSLCSNVPFGSVLTFGQHAEFVRSVPMAE